MDNQSTTHLGRRALLGLGAATAGTALLAACSGSDGKADPAADPSGSTGGSTDTVQLTSAGDGPELKWDMATSWPLSLETIFGGAQVFADTVAALTGGRFTITPKAAGELAPGLEVLNVVESGAVNIGHTASYYYFGKSPVTSFGTALPFGLDQRQQNAWLYEGGGLKLLQDAYAAKFGVIQFPAGNTGCQMGGWFSKEVNGLADLQGLKMRIPGLGGQVMAKLGVNVQVIAAGEIFQALQTGAIDAAEFSGPYDDQKLGFQDAAKFYYYPGWWEPGPSLEVQINLKAWNELPPAYQNAVQAAARTANVQMMGKYDTVNPPALVELQGKGVELRPFPDDVMAAAKEETEKLLDDVAKGDADFASILTQWRAFRDSIRAWHQIAEKALVNLG